MEEGEKIMALMPIKKKKRILKSKSFKKWYRARMKTKKPSKPKNVTQALRWYMIDKSQDAIIEKPSVWRKQTNRADIPGIDKGKQKVWKRQKRKIRRRR